MWISSVIKQAGLCNSWAHWCFHPCQILFPSILSQHRQPQDNLTPPSKAPNRSLRTLRQAYLLSHLQWPWQHSQSHSNWKPAPWVQNLGCWEGYQQCPSQGWMWPQTDSWLTAQQTHLSVYHSLDDLASAWPAKENTWEKDDKKIHWKLGSEFSAYNSFVWEVTQKIRTVFHFNHEKHAQKPEQQCHEKYNKWRLRGYQVPFLTLSPQPESPLSLLLT